MRGDVAFAQSILETGGFANPGSAATDNNFAGIGWCDSCKHGFNFPDAQTGVRAQLQLLRIYVDPTFPDADYKDPILLTGTLNSASAARCRRGGTSGARGRPARSTASGCTTSTSGWSRSPRLDPASRRRSRWRRNRATRRRRRRSAVRRTAARAPRSPRQRRTDARSGARAGAGCRCACCCASTRPARSSSTAPTRSNSSSSTTRISRRARFAPRQWWMPWPKPRCGFGSRARSKRNGSANTRSSRFADASQNTTLSPASIVSPPSSTVAGRGAAVVRRGMRPAHDLLDRGRHHRPVVAQHARAGRGTRSSRRSRPRSRCASCRRPRPTAARRRTAAPGR